MAARPAVAGLTGGIASGKSTVARWFAEWGACIVDADRIAREVVEPGGAAHDAVVRSFGRGILDAGGRVDRAALGRRVFANAEERRELERLLHPAIRTESFRRLSACVERGAAPACVYDAALLVETGAHEELDRLIVVACPSDVQIARIVARDGISEDEARTRIAAQLPLERKIALADWVIDNSGTLERTRLRAREVWEELVGA